MTVSPSAALAEGSTHLQQLHVEEVLWTTRSLHKLLTQLLLLGFLLPFEDKLATEKRHKISDMRRESNVDKIITPFLVFSFCPRDAVLHAPSKTVGDGQAHLGGHGGEVERFMEHELSKDEGAVMVLRVGSVLLKLLHLLPVLQRQSDLQSHTDFVVPFFP